MRALTKPTNPKTEKQVNQRSKFTLALNFLKPITPFLRVGYKLFTTKQTAFNAAMSHVLNNAVIGDNENAVIDFASVLVSKGTLNTAIGATASYISGTITFTWVDNSNTTLANATDKALIVVYNEAKSEAVYGVEGSDRLSLSQSIQLPEEWLGDRVHMYLGFITADGKNVSNSVYVGNIEVAI